MPPAGARPSFHSALARHGVADLRRLPVDTLQVNLGRLCNLACLHCHVEAGPKRPEIMPANVATRLVELLDLNPSVRVLDLTGGAPEMNPNFRYLVTEARQRRIEVIDRCNLTIFFETGYEDLSDFLAANRVRVVASLPCYTAENVDRQRGKGVFHDSVRALQKLNALGYGQGDPTLVLELVYNPLGASLPPAQAALETQYRDELGRLFGITFDRLLTITNMPIRRFAADLGRSGKTESYMELLAGAFNPATVPALMCRSLVSVDWQGNLYDCDFNQMLDLPLGAAPQTGIHTIWDGDSLGELTHARIATSSHCFGCTAGAGSSCSGALA